MTHADLEAELRALLTRAADVEAKRQAAHLHADWPQVARLENELRRLWSRHDQLERQRAA